MRRPEADTLRALVAAAGPGDRRILGPDRSARVADLLAGSVLAGGRAALAGRNVLLATGDLVVAAAALVELDGLAARIVLCPPDVPADQMPTIAARAGIDAVVTDGTGSPVDGIAAPRIEATWPPRPAGPATDPIATEWILLTSGTTGVPKLAGYTLAALVAPVLARPSPPSPVWGTFYDIRRYGGLQMCLRGLLSSGSLVLTGPGEAMPDFLERLGRERVTHLAGTPSHWRRALMTPSLSAVSPAYVRLSGEIADQAILDALRTAFPRAGLGHAYASTEAGVVFEVDDGREGFPASFVGLNAATGVEVAVVDGSIRIRSPRIASGYVGTPEVALAGPDGFVDTGDIVEARGDRLVFAGRRGGIINVGGRKVHPEEVEAVLNRHDGVRVARVEGRRNPIAGAIVVAAVVPRDPGLLEAGEAQAALKGAIAQHCRDALPPYKVPAMIQFVPDIPMSPAGKVLRPHA